MVHRGIAAPLPFEVGAAIVRTGATAAKLPASPISAPGKILLIFLCNVVGDSSMNGARLSLIFGGRQIFSVS